MKKLLLIGALILLTGQLFAQRGGGGRGAGSARTPAPATTPAVLPAAAETREVSGIVLDVKGNPVMGASMSLSSKKDTIKATTNTEGVFVFRNVQLSVFVVSAASIGYKPYVESFKMNDIKKKIILDPIKLKQDEKTLDEVNINGTPSIVYKTDTVEYRAADYHVRENSTVDELLKKMEGFEIGSDGTASYQGQQITKARLNGKDYAGGDVAQAIQNLPAEIVDKIQVVDDYGDQAGLTGIKDGDPQKVLNITTRDDRSVGNIGRATTAEGSNDRYDEKLFLQRINANEQLGLIGELKNTVNGVASTGINASGGGQAGGGSGGSGGTTTSVNPSLSYRDQWSKAVEVNTSYRYTSTDTYSINNSSGQTYTNFKVPGSTSTSSDTTDFTRYSTGQNNTKTHAASFEFDYHPDSTNFLRITPSYSYSNNTNTSDSQSTQIGFNNQYNQGHSVSQNISPNLSLLVLYVYRFKTPRRAFSIQYTVSSGNNQVNTAQNNTILYRDALQNLVLDSLVHRTVNRSNFTKNDRVSVQYAEPLGKLSQLEVVAQYIYRGYNNSAVTSNIDANGFASVVDSLSNIYNYSFKQENISVNYRLNKPKYSLSIGARAIPTHLQGANISKATSTDRNDFYIIPVFRFQYSWSRTEQASINYSGAPSEPTFQEIQPLPDYSNPTNPVFGNPNLKPSFTHSVNLKFNDYLPDSKFNFSVNGTVRYIEDAIITNSVQLPQPKTKSYLNETYYANLTGSNSSNINYNVAKQLDDRNYNLELNGSINYRYTLDQTNSIQTHLTTWEFNERFGPRMTPNTSLEINPYVSFDDNRSYNTLIGSISSHIKTTALNLEGKFYVLEDRTFAIEYNISKNYIQGIAANITKNPFVANFYIEKEFFARKNGILRISAFDVFDQNNYINRSVTTSGYTDTKTNALSRYVLVSFTLNLQKWSGVGKRRGKVMQRRGDGSFIYD